MYLKIQITNDKTLQSLNAKHFGISYWDYTSHRRLDKATVNQVTLYIFY